jgi:predicted lactoylglutathione lyase
VPRMLFVNLPVSDLDASIAFFTALGFQFNPQFTDENATCMVINESACVMLLRRDFFESFHRRGVAEPGSPPEVLNAISADSREEVDDLCNRAFAAGGSKASDPTDQGFMYGWSFTDPDGHIWEVMWMDQSGMPDRP